MMVRCSGLSDDEPDLPSKAAKGLEGAGFCGCACGCPRGAWAWAVSACGGIAGLSARATIEPVARIGRGLGKGVCAKAGAVISTNTAAITTLPPVRLLL